MQEKKVGQIKILDTLFRDGMQQRGMETSQIAALRLVKRMAELGWHYAELGFAVGNDFSREFIKAALGEDLGQMRVAVFGRTRKANERAEDSEDLNAILALGAPTAVIVCKSRLLDVENSLKTDKETNLAMITDSVKHLKSKGLEVILDLEHAVDAWCGRGNFGEDLNDADRQEYREYFLGVVKAGISAEADTVVVCDTNGGASPEEVTEVFDILKEKYPDVDFGIHAHNDNGLALANSRAAVLKGATHVQGVTNGYGERCGNANLLALLPRLQVKDKTPMVEEEAMEQFRSFSKQITIAFNRDPVSQAPFVGKDAFSTFAGMHASSEERDGGAYLQCDPNKIGNNAYVGVNRQSGKANVSYLATRLGISLSGEQLDLFLKKNKDIIQMGGFEISETSFRLACQRLKDNWKDYFVVEEYETSTRRKNGNNESLGKAEVKVRVGEEIEHTIANGIGAYDALSKAMIKALKKYYPDLKEVHLSSYDLHAMGVTEKESSAHVRVMAEFYSKEGERWTTVGLSTDQTDAGKNALVDGLTWFLHERMSEQQKKFA